MTTTGPAGLPVGWGARATPAEILGKNRRSKRSASRRQAAYLSHRCREKGVTTWDLLRFGVELKRIAPITDLPISGPETPTDNAVSILLTGRETEGLFEIVTG